MKVSYDKDKIFDCMFDPITSEILAELENGAKESKHLAQKSKISDDEVRERLSYLLEHKFVKEQTENGKTVFLADAEKLAEIIENDENFDTTVDGLTKMDSYLN